MSDTPTHCHRCPRRITYTKVTLPSKITGDLVFCGFQCANTFSNERAARIAAEKAANTPS